MREREFIARIREQWGKIGDDGFVFDYPEEGGQVVVTTDQMVEGVHFRLDWEGGVEIGWKIVVRNLSDLAAMGSKPKYFFLSVAIPEGQAGEVLEGIREGVDRACRKWEVEWVGGDTVRSPQRWYLTGSAIGFAEAAVRRSGARYGDKIAVTNQLGLPRLSLEFRLKSSPLPEEVERRIRFPEAPVAEAEMIAPYATCMIDISDGLSSELHRLAEESGMGFFIYPDAVPIHPWVEAEAKPLGLDPLSLVFSSGEEYQLLFTARGEDMDYLRATLPVQTGSRITIIGEIGMPGGVFVVKEGKKEPLAESGWTHTF